MSRYRVTLDAPREQYLYEVDAANETEAVELAGMMARGDGLEYSAPRDTRVERLDA